MKWDRSALITLVYSLFVLLYTLYIIAHPGHFNNQKGPHWDYLLGFLHLSSYVYFILQGIVLRARGWTWGLIVLLPTALFLASALVGYLFVGVLRLGGGTLLDKDKPDQLLLCLLFLTGSYFSLRLIRPKKSKRQLLE